MLSGVGPAHHLRDLGLEVKADLPVGQNLQDHTFFYMPVSITSPIAVVEGRGDTALAHLQHALLKSGPLGRHAQENMFFTR